MQVEKIIYKNGEEEGHGHARIEHVWINDKNLSISALSVLVFIASQPQGKIAKLSDIEKRFKLSRSAVQRYLLKLEDLGYIKRCKEKE